LLDKDVRNALPKAGAARNRRVYNGNEA